MRVGVVSRRGLSDVVLQHSKIEATVSESIPSYLERLYHGHALALLKCNIRDHSICRSYVPLWQRISERPAAPPEENTVKVQTPS